MQEPSSAHLLNPLWIEFHIPSRSGTSRHGAAVRCFQAIPSTARRWSVHGRDLPVTAGINLTDLNPGPTVHQTTDGIHISVGPDNSDTTIPASHKVEPDNSDEPGLLKGDRTPAISTHSGQVVEDDAGDDEDDTDRYS
ncbi:hypothetical protein GCM10009820_15080 [Leifsonia soli]